MNGRQSSEEVLRVLERAAYFSIFSVPDSEQRSEGTPLIPFGNLVYRIEIGGSPRRHQVTVAPPSASHGFRTAVTGGGQRVARQNLTLEVMPNSFEPAPGRRPPPTLLLPPLSQRFCIPDGRFDFLDAEGSGFDAFAAGRFFAGGASPLRVGGVVDLLRGRGHLRGSTANLVLNGTADPPESFAHHYLLRVVDPEGRLAGGAPIPPPPPLDRRPPDRYPPVRRPTDDPEPDSASIPLMADLDPGHPPVVEPSGEGSEKRIHLVERLRLVETAFDVRPALRSRTVPGQTVGHRRTTLVFDPDDPNEVIPLRSTDGEFVFFADGDRRKRIGSLRADLFEGRVFRTTLPQLARPFFRVAGYGPFITGTGQFGRLPGLVSMNGALSLDPPAFTAMYMLRMADPVGRFDRAAQESARRSA